MPRRDPAQVRPAVQTKVSRPRKEEKWSKVQPVLVAGGTGAIWNPRRYDVFAKEAYLTQVVSYRCIDEIAKAIEALEWKIDRRKKDGSVEQVTDHPILDLMYRPNPEQTFGEIGYRHTAFGIISGNAYMERIGASTGRNVGRWRELWSHRPDRMTVNVNPDSGVRRGYKYTGPSGKTREWPVDPITGQSDIWHMRFFHPLNDWYGAGPVEPTSREIDTSNEAMEYNKNLLQNQGRPGMVVAFKGNIGDTEYNRLTKSLREKYSGPRNAGKNLIIEGEGATVSPYGWSPLDLDYIEGNRELARRIALGFGVPPQLLGIPGDNTYSNYAEARLAFYENTVFFYATRFGKGFSMWMFEPGERMLLTPDLDKIAALEPRRKEKFEKAEKADFLTINEKRVMCGYETYAAAQKDAKKDDEGNAEDPADKIYQNASMMALGEEPEEPAQPGYGDYEPAPDDEPLPEDEEGGQPKKKPAGKKPGEEE